MAEVESLPESHLGTKEHWDQVYEREVKVYEDIGDEGEIWFGEDSVERMIRFLLEWIEENHGDKAPYILDLGTGNGHLLFSLLEAQEEELPEGIVDPSKLCGIDYSTASIALSRSIGSKRLNGCEQVVFEVADLRDAQQVDHLSSKANDGLGWDIVCDKGTYDAIALSSQPIDGKLPVEHYVGAVRALTRPLTPDTPSGIFFITSCNFTQEELIATFCPAGFSVVHVVPTPTFQFGGQKGSTVTSIAFQRVETP
ncbi:Similar to S.cerevisiae protein EFM4 (Lysine methyltransferase) [Malassezia sympodialis ATCC 42132]|uniref:Protein-lysine N-methyltransferase EFM4 n=1 Tax=Malassezia sympodialis (strain ATCC 42132) TaxID=1230383 RepID=A0A1M8ACA8_MALS4|nr:Similar to S.cerevisiae protein EFM4 (Lysine methyltransferase) [Malassezia sympodialis ATCC 42132]